MAASSIYATGTVTVPANDTAVTGVGTAWATAGVLPGALIFADGLDRPLVVRSVTSDTAIMLDMPAPAAVTDAAYVMLRRGSDAQLVELLSRLLAQQSAAFDLDGEDKSLLLTTDGGTVTTGFATETTGEGRWRYGLVDGDLDTFRFQRWTGAAWADVFRVDRITGVTTWDAAPTETTSYMEALRDDCIAAASSAADDAAVIAIDKGVVVEKAAEAAAASSLADSRATSSAASAQTASTALALIQAAQIAIAAVAVPSLPHLLDGLMPGELLSAPSGAVMHAGVYGALTDLLTISTGSKRVIGPSGSLDTVAANQPAFDWSTGRRRLRLEAKSATKYGPYSEAIGAHWTLGGVTAGGTALGADGTAGLSELIEDTSTGVHRAFVSTSYFPAATAAGDAFAVQVDVKAGVGSRNVVIYATGTAISPSQTLVVNPATGAVVSQSSGLSRVSVTARPGGIWHVEATYVATMAGATQTGLYLASGTATSYAGDGASSVYVGYFNVEKVASATSPPSSYMSIPTTAAVTRIADDLRLSPAVLAIANGAASTLCLRGQLDAAPVGIQFLVGDVNARRLLYTNGADPQIGTYYGDAIGSATAATGTLSSGFGVVVSRFLGGASKLCLNGGAVANLTTDPAETLATARLFADGLGAGACNGWVDDLVIWPLVGSDAALQAQAHVYGA